MDIQKLSDFSHLNNPFGGKADETGKEVGLWR
jgi:hypothetical protein